MGENFLLKLTDGGIIDIITDNDYIEGCPTCDYGSEYINDIIIATTKFKAFFTINRTYDYVYDDILKVILPNIDIIKEMRELEFIQWFLSKMLEIKKESSNYKLKYELYSDKDKKIIEEIIF